MKALLPRGLAALAMLAILPRLSALEFTQTHSFAFNGVGQGAPALLFDDSWTITPFSSVGSYLNLVEVTLSVAGSASNWDPNFQAISALHLEGIVVSIFNGFPGDGAPVLTQSFRGPLVSIAPGGSFTFNTSIDTQGLNTYIGSASASFISPSNPFRTAVTISGIGGYSQLTANGTAHVSIKYIYDLPDRGYTLALLTIAMIGTCAAHRHRRRPIIALWKARDV